MLARCCIFAPSLFYITVYKFSILNKKEKFLSIMIKLLSLSLSSLNNLMKFRCFIIYSFIQIFHDIKRKIEKRESDVT